MAIGRQMRFLEHESTSGLLGQPAFTSTTWATPAVTWEGEDILMLIKTDAAPTGTTPSFTPTLQLSTDGGAFANVAAGTAISTATWQATVFAGSTIATYANTHTYFIRILFTAANADNVESGMSAELDYLY